MLRAKLNTLQILGGQDDNVTRSFGYEGVDGRSYFQKVDFTQEYPQVADLLPAHPYGINFWSQYCFHESGEFLYARYHCEEATLESECWTIQNGHWICIFKGEYPKNYCNSFGNNIYRFSFGDDDKLTIFYYNKDNKNFESTNVQELPLKKIFGDFYVAKNNSKLILALQEYDGQRGPRYFWHYLPAAQDPDFAEELEKLKMSELEMELDWSLELCWAQMKEQSIPYYYKSPDDKNNDKTLVLFEGGPDMEYCGGFEDLMKVFTQAGWSVIIPQESPPTGYGWTHFSRGFGELGRKNLHQLLHVMHSAINAEHIKDPTKVYFYGKSYGGFAVTSLALRWNDLHEEAGLGKIFDPQLVVADAAWVEFNPAERNPNHIYFMKGQKKEEFSRSFPAAHVQISTTLPELVFIHGKKDKLCSISAAEGFSHMLNTKGYFHQLWLHEGNHGVEKEQEFAEFLLAFMERRDCKSLADTAGLSLQK